MIRVFATDRLWSIGIAIVMVTAGYAASPAAPSAARGQQSSAPPSAAPTPRTPDGKPDLSGVWNQPPGPYRGILSTRPEQRAKGILFSSRRCVPNQKGCRENTNQNNDEVMIGRMDANRPVYHPDYWDKIQDIDYNTNTTDPKFECLPDGLPRVGPPQKIVQTATEVIFFYASGFGRNHYYRIIPIDGRPHDPIRSKDISFYGDAIGSWEGGTLVVDTLGFNDTTWLAEKGGYIHSTQMHVIERLRREGNTLHYQVTVEDPEVLLQPWVMDSIPLRLHPDPKALLYEQDPCREFRALDPGTRLHH